MGGVGDSAVEDDLKKLFALRELQEHPCEAIIRAAHKYYAEPYSDLKYKKPLQEMYKLEATDVSFGHWVAEVPKPGDVAGCSKYKLRNRIMPF